MALAVSQFSLTPFCSCPWVYRGAMSDVHQRERGRGLARLCDLRACCGGNAGPSSEWYRRLTIFARALGLSHWVISFRVRSGESQAGSQARTRLYSSKLPRLLHAHVNSLFSCSLFSVWLFDVTKSDDNHSCPTSPPSLILDISDNCSRGMVVAGWRPGMVHLDNLDTQQTRGQNKSQETPKRRRQCDLMQRDLERIETEEAEEAEETTETTEDDKGERVVIRPSSA